MLLFVSQVSQLTATVLNDFGREAAAVVGLGTESRSVDNASARRRARFCSADCRSRRLRRRAVESLSTPLILKAVLYRRNAVCKLGSIIVLYHRTVSNVATYRLL